MNDEFNDAFKKWQYEVKEDIKAWTDRLVKEALKQGNGKKAERWLKSKRPDYPDSYNGKPEEYFTVITKGIYDEAIYKVRDIAMEQEFSDASI